MFLFSESVCVEEMVVVEVEDVRLCASSFTARHLLMADPASDGQTK